MSLLFHSATQISDAPEFLEKSIAPVFAAEQIPNENYVVLHHFVPTLVPLLTGNPAASGAACSRALSVFLLVMGGRW